MAMGGMMQLELGKVAVKMGSSDDVKMIAKAEVEEQMILSAKLMEIAKSGGAKLPESPDEKTAGAVKMLKEKSGAEFDKAYLKHSGIEGHEMLKATMEKVSAKAESASLKGVAMAALPLIKVHLQVSKDESAELA
jgi:putative membrane protein